MREAFNLIEESEKERYIGKSFTMTFLNEDFIHKGIVRDINGYGGNYAA